MFHREYGFPIWQRVQWCDGVVLGAIQLHLFQAEGTGGHVLDLCLQVDFVDFRIVELGFHIEWLQHLELEKLSQRLSIARRSRVVHFADETERNSGYTYYWGFQKTVLCTALDYMEEQACGCNYLVLLTCVFRFPSPRIVSHRQWFHPAAIPPATWRSRAWIG